MNLAERISYINSLSKSRTPEAVPPLIDFLLHDPSIEVRERAASGLRWVEGAAVMAALLQVIENKQEAPFVREMALEAIRYHAPNDAVASLIDCLDDPFPEVRYWAVNTLGYTASHDAVSALLGVFAHDTGTVPIWGTIADAASQAITSIRQNMTSD